MSLLRLRTQRRQKRRTRRRQSRRQMVGKRRLAPPTEKRRVR
jgi:hypothetical protein